MQNKINVGIIGKNFGYHVIYKSFLKNKEYRVKGFSFKSKKKNKIKIPKNIKIYSNWKKLVSDKKIDTIVIAAPPFLHKNIIRFAIKNNKHIFCEKPFTSSYKEAKDICNLIKKNKNIFHMVNYQFANISAFNFFKKKIIKNIKIIGISLDWFINLNRKTGKSWKENHARGGGIIFNYICHSIYYLEFLFGKIASIKTKISLKKNGKVKSFKGTIFFNENLSARLNIQVGLIEKSVEPTHKLQIFTKSKNYILKTDLNSLTDKFKLASVDKNSRKIEKILFQEKSNKNDFRIKPTSKNLKIFSSSIAKKKLENPNFFDAKRIHLIIDKMLISSKKKKEINILN